MSLVPVASLSGKEVIHLHNPVQVISSKIVVTTYNTTWCHNSEYNDLSTILMCCLAPNSTLERFFSWAV
jgi:hypothetical protein